jgi:hypothetical protein
MKTITLTHNKKKVLVNWANVQFAKETGDHFGNDYVEVYFSNSDYISVEEGLADIELLLLNKTTNHFGQSVIAGQD